MTDLTATQELVISRVFDAPRELVYKAFTDPEQLVKWFGPAGWSVPRDTITVEQKIGGRYQMVMVNDSDPSLRSPVAATFTELVENELIVGVEEWPGIPGVQGRTRMQMRIELHDDGGKTRLELRQGPYTSAIEGDARAGWESSFKKLDALLAIA